MIDIPKKFIVMTRTRFNIGDTVQVRPDETTPFSGLQATVREIRPDHRGISILDVYVVLFQWGEEHQFYDAQLQERK